MEISRSSVTAEQMALSRAIETCKPRDQRICCDPFAKRFLSLKYRVLLVSRPVRDATERLIESMFAGHHYYVVARTRYFDDVLAAVLADPVEQLVILGAGYDSRALRFADRLSRTTVFEVDHPATSLVKRTAISRVAPDGVAPRTILSHSTSPSTPSRTDSLSLATSRAPERLSSGRALLHTSMPRRSTTRSSSCGRAALPAVLWSSITSYGRSLRAAVP